MSILCAGANEIFGFDTENRNVISTWDQPDGVKKIGTMSSNAFAFQREKNVMVRTPNECAIYCTDGTFCTYGTELLTVNEKVCQNYLEKNLLQNLLIFVNFFCNYV